MAKSITVNIVGDASSLQRAFATAGGAATGFGSRIGGIGGTLAAVGKVALVAGAAIGGGLVAGAVTALTKFAEFEAALNTFQSVANATGAEMKTVSDRAKELGNDLSLPGTSAKDAADAMTELAKGGLSVEESMEAAKAAIQLSTAAQVDNAHAAEIMADAMNTFNLEGKDAAHVADLLANGANATTASIDDMAMALKAVGGVANQVGLDIDETVTSLAMMADAGVKGSDAGTSLKTMLLSLAAPTEKAAGLMKDLGFNTRDMHGELLPMPQLIENWRAATEGMTDAQELATMKTIFGTDAVRAAGAILGSEKGKWDEMAGAMDRQGSAAEQAAAKSEGLKGAWDGLKSALETGAITIGEQLAPAVEDIVRKVGDFISKMAEADSVGEAFEIALSGIGSVAGDLRTAIGDLLSKIDWGAVADQAGEVFSGFVGMVKKVDWAGVGSAIFDLLSAAIPPALSGLKEIFVGVFTGIGEAMGRALRDPLLEGMREVTVFLTGALAEASGLVADALQAVGDLIPDALGGGAFDDAAEAVRGFADDMQDAEARARDWKSESELLEEALSNANTEIERGVDSTTDLVETFRGANGAVKVTESQFGAMTQALVATTGQVKVADAATAVLIATYGRVPTKVETQALLDDPAAKAALTAWVAQINGTPATVDTKANMLKEQAEQHANELRTAIEAIPKRTQTNHNGNASDAKRAAGEARTAIASVPTSHHTTFTGSVSSSLAGAIAAAGGAGAYGGAGGPQARGTMYHRGGMSLVGEHGPELVAFPRGAQIYSHGKTTSMMHGSGGGGGGAVYITVNVEGSVLSSEQDLAIAVRKALAGHSMYTPSLWGGR